MSKTLDKKGFSLIELMIVVSILAILAAITIPKFANSIRKSREATTYANLAMIRNAITVFYADNEGIYPTDDLTSLIPTYINKIPDARTPPYHSNSNTVKAGPPAVSGLPDIDDAGGWYYNNTLIGTPGEIVVNCSHADSKGIVWPNY